MEKLILDSPKSGSELVLETLRDLGIDTILVIQAGLYCLYMMLFIILKASAIF